MSALRLLPPGEFSWKTKLEELSSQIKALNDDSPDSEKDQIKRTALKALELLEVLTPNAGDSISSLIGRCYEIEASLTPLKLSCNHSESIRNFPRNSRKPQNNVIKKIHDIMAQILSSTALNQIKNTSKIELVTLSLSSDPDQIMLQIAITSTYDYQHATLERKLELLNRTSTLLMIIPRQKKTLEVFMLYAQATCCMSKEEFEGMITSIDAIGSKDSLDIAYGCIVLHRADPGESIASRKSKLLKYIKDEGIIIFEVLNSRDKSFERGLLEKANINFGMMNSDDETLLHLFAKVGNLEMVSYLISRKVNLAIRSYYGNTPYMELRMRGLSIAKEIPSDEFGYRLKMATLIWGLSGQIKLPDRTNYNSEWGSTRFALAEDVLSLPSFHLGIKLAFFKTSEKRSREDIYRDIHAGMLTIIDTGCLSHWIVLVFYQDLLFICNRGAGAFIGNHLTCFRIDHKKITLKLIQSIHDVRLKKIDEALPVIYNTLPLSLSQDGIVQPITSEFKELQPKSQKTRNCNAASTKLAIRACLAALTYKKDGDFLSPQKSKSIMSDSKMATRFLRKLSYERLKKEMDGFPKKISTLILDHFEKKRIKYRIDR